MEVWKYIRLISKMSDRYGDKLLALMEENHVGSLREITLDQAKRFYELRCAA